MGSTPLLATMGSLERLILAQAAASDSWKQARDVEKRKQAAAAAAAAAEGSEQAAAPAGGAAGGAGAPGAAAAGGDVAMAGEDGRPISPQNDDDMEDAVEAAGVDAM
jgi:hypothetical protein